jgi:hypothetical protein
MLIATASALALTAVASSRSLEGGGTAPPDPAGDSGSAPDFTTLALANDNAGKLSWRIGLGNRTQFIAPDFIQILIDADAKDTGMNGFEFLIQADPAQGVDLFRWNGDWQGTESKTLTASFTGGVLEISLDFRELGSERIFFYLYSDTVPITADDQLDEAPDGEDLYSYFVQVPLLFKSLSRPARVVAGRAAKLSLVSWTDSSQTARVTCAGRIGTKRVGGKPASSTATIAVPLPNGELVTMSYQATTSCSFAVARSAKGKTFSARITSRKSGVSVTRTMVAKIR